MRREAYLIATIAALEGLAGVVFAALSAHVAESPLLQTASSFLSVHAGAGLGLAALAEVSTQWRRALVSIALLLQAGVALFSADMAMRALGPGKLFPFAAPIGGSATIAAWAALAIWGAMRFAAAKEKS